MLTLEPWHLAGVFAVVVLACVAVYLSRKAKQPRTADDADAVHPGVMEPTESTQRRADQLARLAPRTERTSGPVAAVGLPDEQLQARALDLVAQLRLLVAEGSAESDHGLAGAPPDVGVGERRAPERLGEARHARATMLYQRIRDEAVDVRTTILGRLDGRPLPARKAGVDRSYDYQAGAQSFRDIADDLELLALALGRE